VVVECPKCGHVQLFEGGECERCGIIFARFKQSQERRSPRAPAPAAELGAASQGQVGLVAATGGVVAVGAVAVAPTRGRLGAAHGDAGFDDEGPVDDEVSIEPEAGPIDRRGWIAFGIGVGLALLTELLPILRVVIGYFVILVHEMGHAATGWLFGYPSIPAFDFTYGGGVTSHQDQMLLLVLLVYAALAALLWVFRSNWLSLGIVLAATLVYSALLVTNGHDIAVLAMGHGSELVFAGLFIHRALSGRACHHGLERPLYAWIGFHIVFHDMRFAYGLVTSEFAREMYAGAKGGGHWMDFSRLAGEYFSVSLETVAGIFLLLCLLPPIVAVAANLARRRLADVWERLARV
jgi:hypothetical protein